MDNDSRGLLFFIFGFTCIWLVFDEFYGKKRISSLTTLLTPNLPSLGSLAAQAGQKVLDTAGSIADTGTQQNIQQTIKNDPKLTPKEKKTYSDALNPFSPSHGGALGG